MIITDNGQERGLHQRIGLVLGPAVALIMLLADAPEGLSPTGWRTAAIGLWMAIWWATEAVPIAVTALLPIVLFPMLGVSSIQDATGSYFNRIVALFLGGFIIAFAMQRWNLHRRVALAILDKTGNSGSTLIGGFMLSAALLSMWVMNTSTTMMLLPIAVSIVGVIHQTVSGLNDREKDDFQCALLLGIAYAATIGGMATLVGTAPNAILAQFMHDNYDTAIDFASWMLVGLPLSAILLPLTWIVLTRLVFRVNFKTSAEGRATIAGLRRDLGPISKPESRVAAVFILTALAWITRPLLTHIPALEGLDDAVIAVGGALLLFLLPSGEKSDPALMRWRYAEQLPWGVLILFGGGLTLAGAVQSSGLSVWLGDQLSIISSLPLPVMVALAATMIIFLTELTSNITTTVTFLPVVAAVAVEAGVDPIVLTVPITLAASCAFMLPVATPPNAIVFGSGLLTIPKMVRAGFALNLVGIVIVSTVAITLAPRVFG